MSVPDLRLLGERIYANERAKCCADICGCCGGRDRIAAPEVINVNGSFRHLARSAKQRKAGKTFKCFASPIRERAEREREKESRKP